MFYRIILLASAVVGLALMAYGFASALLGGLQ